MAKKLLSVVLLVISLVALLSLSAVEVRAETCDHTYNDADVCTKCAAGKYVEIPDDITGFMFSPANGEKVPQKAYPVRGKITSRYPLKTVKAYIDGECFATVNLGEETELNLRNSIINEKLDFATLSVGKHTLTIKAKDTVTDEWVTVCKNVFTTKDTTTACDHDYTNKVTKEATCIANGVRTYTCSKCDATYTKPIPAVAHKFTSVDVIEPSYTYNGYTEYSCPGCGESTRGNFTDPLGLPRMKISVKNQAGTGKPVVYWKDVDQADRYYVYRADSENGTYQQIGKTEKTSYVDTTAVAGKTYYYKAKAGCDADSSLNGKASAAVSIKCKQSGPKVTVTTNSKGQPVIKWGKISGAKKYEVWYSTDGGNTYKKLTTTKSTSHTHAKATSGKTYSYKVRVYSSAKTNTNEFSNVESATRKLATPTLTTKTNKSAGKVTLSWKKITGATKYVVQCSTNDGDFKTLTTTTKCSYVHKGLSNGNQYEYRVRAICANDAAKSNYSKTKTCTFKCKAPVLRLDNTYSTPTVYWDMDNSVKGAVKFQVYYATSKNGKYKLLETTTSPGVYHEAAVPGKTYYYKVRGIDKNGIAGEFSKVKSIACLEQAPEIEDIIFDVHGDRYIWIEEYGKSALFEIWYSTEKYDNYKKLVTTPNNMYIHSPSKDRAYYYKVRVKGDTKKYNSPFTEPFRMPSFSEYLAGL